MKRFIKLLATAALVLSFSAPALAGDSGRVDLPVLPKAKGAQCVEPTDVMRRNHMDYLKHHRDATMRQGIRTKKYSLKACIECHVPAQSTQASEQEHFCKSCHLYAGVRPDCFQCHATQPEKTSSFTPLTSDKMQAMGEASAPLSVELLDQLAKNEKNTTGAIQ